MSIIYRYLIINYEAPKFADSPKADIKPESIKAFIEKVKDDLKR